MLKSLDSSKLFQSNQNLMICKTIYGFHFCFNFHCLGVTDTISAFSGLKSGYSPVSTVYSQPPVQRQVAALKPPPAASSVSSSYTIYPTSTSVQQTPAPISTYTHSSSFNSTAATSYSGTAASDSHSCATNSHQLSSNGVAFFVATAGLSYSSYESSGYTSAPSYFQPTQLAPPQAQPQPPLQQPQQPPPPPPQQTQQPPKQLANSSWSNTAVTSPAVNAYKKPIFHQNKIQKPKGPPKQPQLHYCDICKISCAGPQVNPTFSNMITSAL